MSRAVSYDRQTVDSRNPAKRFAHRSRLKRAAMLADRYLPDNGALLDFGAGAGKFLSNVKVARPDAVMLGFDKFKGPANAGLNYIDSFDQLPDRSIDVLTAFEVLEHVIDEDLVSFLMHSKRLLSKDGVLIVSVPIVYGPIVLIKEVSQMVARQRAPEYSFAELYSVLVGRRIPRPPTKDRYQTHKGFDFRKLRTQLSEHFAIETEMLSPFPSLPWMFNSQVFFLAKHSRTRP